MTRHLRGLVAAALALVLLPLAPAHAGSSRHEGDCSFDTVSQDDVTGEDRWTGIVFATVFLYGRDHANVVNATVTCELRVNGVTRASTSGWGSGVVAFADTLAYTATDGDHVDMCTTVDFTSDDTPTLHHCGELTASQFPPQEVIDLLDAVFGWLAAGMFTYVDPTVCSVLTTLAPGTPPVTIANGGDVYVDGQLFWDCPPYEFGPSPEPWPPGPPPLPEVVPVVEPWVPTGGGYNTGDAGVLLLTERTRRDLASTCAFVTNPATGTTTVLGTTVTAGASSATVRCRLTDTATGALRYDESVTADAPVARLRDTIPANAAPVTLCTEGRGEWAEHTSAAGPHCRPGEPLGGH